jgi:hypothetical protein
MSYRARRPDLHQEEDAVPMWAFVAFLAVVLGVSAVIVAWATSMVDARAHEIRPAGDFPERRLGPRQAVGRVREDLFDERGRTLAGVERAELGTYGWVDRERGVARIPISRAMDLVVEGRLP